MVVVMVNAENAAAQSKAYGGLLHATAARPSFEVATIRPSAPNPELRLRGITMRPDGIKIQGDSIKDVIEFAYAIPSDNELSGGPDWIRTEMFDIAAKPDQAEALALSKLSDKDLRTQMRLMVQSLLEDRLHLKVSFATKDLPFLALVVAKGGFKCTNTASDAPLASTGRPRSGADGLPQPPPGPPPPPGYVPPAAGHESGREQAMRWSPHGWPFSLIVASITRQPELGGRMVVDKTGLDGTYDCDLSWVPEGADVAGPSLFTAIQEQMGLKLQPEKGTVETIVVSHIEQPSDN
jgi:bla regulator protein blaR1